MIAVYRPLARLAPALVLLIVAPAAAQTATPPPEPASAPELEVPPAEDPWTFSLSTYFYIVPDGRDYVQPTLAVDHDWLHLEARYNYEDLDTASLWLGYNFSFGEELTVDLTPMIGAVVGETDGVAPGYEITLAWRRLTLYTEGEFVFDAEGSEGDFFYSWSELTFSPCDWLRAGLAAQRTRIRDEDSAIDIGPMAGVTWKRLDLSAYALFPEHGDPTIVFGLGIEF
jgi:hypothetical protein